MRVALWLTALCTCSAFAADLPVDLSDPPRGSLERVVAPEYPPEALARGQIGVVWVEGKAKYNGFVEELSYRPDKPESDVFVGSLKQVARDWKFVPAYDNDCKPSDAPFAVEVSFEIENGQPRIFVTHRKAAREVPGGRAHFKPTHRVNPRYPGSALQRRMMADVFAKLVIDRSGKVTDVKVHAYTSPKLPEGRTNPFVQYTENAMREWEFPPVPPESEAPWVGCWAVHYRISE